MLVKPHTLAALALLLTLPLAACSSTTSETKDGQQPAASKQTSGTPDCASAAVQRTLTYCVSPAAAEYARTMDDFNKKMKAGNSPLDLFPLPLDGAQVQGDEAAAVTIVVFSDLECPTCARFHAQLEGLRKKYPKQLRLAYRHFPLPQHQQGMPAARAALAAGEQGKFWEFVHAAYAQQDKLSDATYEAIVKEIGGDVAAWKKSYADPKHEATIKADMKAGQELGLAYTPYAFINGVLLPPQALSDEQLSGFIESQAKIARAFQDAGVPGREVYWRLVKANFDPQTIEQAKAERERERQERVPVMVDPGTSPSKGASPEAALVTIVEFSDFECPFCSRANGPLMQVLGDYKDSVRVVFKHYPLPFHKRADDASALSIVAAAEGKFWEAHDLLFDNQRALEDDDLKNYAKKIGLKTEDVLAAMRDDKVTAIIKADMELGSSLGVNGTPTLFINGRRLSGALPYEQLKLLVAEEINLAKKLSAEKNLKGDALYKAVIAHKKQAAGE